MLVIQTRIPVTEYNDWTGECRVAYSLVGICVRVENDDPTYRPSSSR